MDDKTLSFVGLVVVPVSCAVFAAVFAVAHQWLTERSREKRDVADKAEEQTMRLWAFAHEAVSLHRRWVLYVRQIHRGEGLSASRPYEWVGPSALDSYMRVGATNKILQAIHTIKQLNAQVTLQLDRAQVSARNYALLPLDASNRDEMEAALRNDLGRIMGFVFSPDEWKPVCDAIAILLDAASLGTDVSELRDSFKAQVKEGNNILKEREAGAARD